VIRSTASWIFIAQLSYAASLFMSHLGNTVGESLYWIAFPGSLAFSAYPSRTGIVPGSCYLSLTELDSRLLNTVGTVLTDGTVRDSIYVNQHSVGRTDERSGTRRKQRHGMKVTIESSEKLQTLSYLRQEISLPVIKELK
jgi:hypothetical protein